jgi:hypothetical protein
LFGKLTDQLFHLGKVRLFPAVGKDTGAELDHHSADFLQELTSHRRLRSK